MNNIKPIIMPPPEVVDNYVRLSQINLLNQIKKELSKENWYYSSDVDSFISILDCHIAELKGENE